MCKVCVTASATSSSCTIAKFNGITFDPYGNLTCGQVSQMPFNMGWTFTGVVRY